MRYIFLAFFIAISIAVFGQKTIKTIIEENKFTGLDGKEMSFTEIIKSNKGKVIYIDFWASWCLPCKKEMPASLRLNKKFSDEEIVFVYISIDENTAAWKKSMERMKIKNAGPHFRRNQSEMSDFLKSFYIYTIPHYMIIGKNSQIHNRDALPPSDRKLERQLSKLISVK
jgi:thiol-disulfide isomerase/thioredoxin